VSSTHGTLFHDGFADPPVAFVYYFLLQSILVELIDGWQIHIGAIDVSITDKGGNVKKLAPFFLYYFYLI
jgi:hypothetical protein